MVAFKDNLEVITLQGDLKQSVPFSEDEEHSKPPKHFVERLKRSAVEATRNNIGYLKGTIGKPVVHALKGLKGL